MGVIEMDPADVLKAIAGYQNELDPEQKALDAFYRQFSCKVCGSTVQKEFSSKNAYTDPNTMNARALLRCTRCRCLFDPHTGIVLERGDTAMAPDGSPLVRGSRG